MVCTQHWGKNQLSWSPTQHLALSRSPFIQCPGQQFPKRDFGGLRTNFSFQRGTCTPEVYKRGDFYKNIVLGQGFLSFEASSCGLWIKFEASWFRVVTTSSAFRDQHLPPEESSSQLQPTATTLQGTPSSPLRLQEKQSISSFVWKDEYLSSSTWVCVSPSLSND